MDKTWIDEMIERESVPQAVRTETVEAFAKRNGISVPTYYYQSYKEENQKKILEITLNVAKKEVPEILQVLIENCKKGKEKSIEMYLDYIIKLAKNLDIKSDGKALANLTKEQQAFLDKLLYDKQDSNGQSNTGNTSGESLPV